MVPEVPHVVDAHEDEVVAAGSSVDEEEEEETLRRVSPPRFFTADDQQTTTNKDVASLHSHFVPLPTEPPAPPAALDVHLPTPPSVLSSRRGGRRGSLRSRRGTKPTPSITVPPPTQAKPLPPPALDRRWAAASTVACSPSPQRPPSVTTHASIASNHHHPEHHREDNIERQALLRQLDLLRMRFNQSVIPGDIEKQRTPVVKLVVEQNLVQLQRARSVACFKLGLAGVLVVIEFVISRFSGLDMSRFMRWNLSNEAETPLRVEGRMNDAPGTEGASFTIFFSASPHPTLHPPTEFLRHVTQLFPEIRFTEPHIEHHFGHLPIHQDHLPLRIDELLTQEVPGLAGV